MALKLAGEECSVVEGLDNLGWLREISVNDADPALLIDQGGAGDALKLSNGDLDLNGNLLKGAKLGTVLNANGNNLENVLLIEGPTGASLSIRPYPDAANRQVTFVTRNAANSDWLQRLLINGYADVVDVDILNANLDLNNNTIKSVGTIEPASASDVVLTVKGTSSQAANLQEWQDSGATVKARVDPAGKLNCPSVQLAPGSAPGSPSEGEVYYDSTAKKLKMYNGTAWETISSA